MGNTTNTQCGNGDFENGAVSSAEWSGAYGTLMQNNSDPSFATYTNGFSPSAVGTNLPIGTSTNNHLSLLTL